MAIDIEDVKFDRYFEENSSEYKARVTEIFTKIIYVDALSIEDAIERIEDRYLNGNLIFSDLDYDDLEIEFI